MVAELAGYFAGHGQRLPPLASPIIPTALALGVVAPVTAVAQGPLPQPYRTLLAGHLTGDMTALDRDAAAHNLPAKNHAEAPVCAELGGSDCDGQG